MEASGNSVRDFPWALTKGSLSWGLKRDLGVSKYPGTQYGPEIVMQNPAYKEPKFTETHISGEYMALQGLYLPYSSQL